MGLIEDIINGIPANPALREQLLMVKSELAKSKDEIAFVKDGLHDAKSEIAKQQVQIQSLEAENLKLKEENYRLTHHLDLDEIALTILRIIAQNDGQIDHLQLIEQTKIRTTKLDYYLEQLKLNEYLNLYYSMWGDQPVCKLTQKGRKFAIDSNLI